MIKTAIVGLGFMGATHIRAYRKIPNVTLAAVCSPSGRNLDGDLSRVAGNLGDSDPVRLDMAQVRAFQSYQELLADPSIDLIDICTPTRTHCELAIAALQAGKHVLCEKPLARTAKAARRVVDVAGESKGFFMPSMCLRFWPEWAWLKRVIADDRFGRVLSASFRRVAPPPAWGQKNFFDGAQSGGALIDLHIHDTDFVQFCFGKPRSVFSTGYTKFSGAIDHVLTQYEVSSGAMVSAEGGWAMSEGFGFSMSYTVNFQRATAVYDVARGAEALHLYQDGKPPEIMKFEEPDGFVGELTHMLESIRSGKAPTVVTAADGLAAVEICEAEERSVSLRKPVLVAV
ncbi:MAG: Gfo/Idh/MocA family oxidoreductase [Verrucomicrobia bacterium]|nr:Gfo/Idh/MocA family oxidoreductase [Verrucomicrobiota bacterium]